MRTVLVALFLTALLAVHVVGDIFLHYPPGSNNRNCENGNLGNANRLFRSENGNGGGYNCPRARGGPDVETPRMYYYQGTKLRIEWTMQHACSAPYTHCQVVLQYMCDDTVPGLRDGLPDPTSNDGQIAQGIATINQANKDNILYGQHEPWEYYRKCNVRERNTGLFIADRNLNGNTATRTRQNNNGARYGYECPEERDYYPYWHPTPWKDMAIFTTNASMCEWYQQESQNVKETGECFDVNDRTTPTAPNNQHACESRNGVWITRPAHGIPPPECLDANEYIASPDNHLGVTSKGDLPHYWWTIPEIKSKSCVIRVRYNITTGDYHPFETFSTSNGANSPVKTLENSNDNYYADFGYGHELAIKMNTNQYGRTFQDRTHTFEIRERPEEYKHRVIHNLNVRGKRGNLQNIYPNMEYDFVPRRLVVNGGDLVHIQWTGSDYNANQNSNAAEGGPEDENGQRRADRTNLVQIDALSSMPRRAEHNTMFVRPDGTPDMELIRKLALLDQPFGDTNSAIRCKNFTQLLSEYRASGRNTNNIQYDRQNCAKLGGARSPYFDAGLVEMRAHGTFHILSTRNNNFSNRGQRGVIVVHGGYFAGASSITSNFYVVALSCLFSFLLFILF